MNIGQLSYQLGQELSSVLLHNAVLTVKASLLNKEALWKLPEHN